MIFSLFNKAVKIKNLLQFDLFNKREDDLFTGQVNDEGKKLLPSDTNPNVRRWQNTEDTETNENKPEESYIGNIGNSESENKDHNYNANVARNLKHMDTPVSEWKAVPVKNVVVTKNDKGKAVSMPEFDFEVCKDFAHAPSLYANSSNSDACCELCGTGIKKVYWLYNQNKKWTLAVGSECVTHFQEGESGEQLSRSKKIELAKDLIREGKDLQLQLLKTYYQHTQTYSGARGGFFTKGHARRLNNRAFKLFNKSEDNEKELLNFFTRNREKAETLIKEIKSMLWIKPMDIKESRVDKIESTGDTIVKYKVFYKDDKYDYDQYTQKELDKMYFNWEETFFPAQTKSFKNWFGDSKVVDKDGNPLVVYHGTNNEFDVFNIGTPKSAPGNFRGVYFVDNEREAKDYGEKTKAVYLRITNPLIGHPYEEYAKSKGIDYHANRFTITKDEVEKWILENKFDGIIRPAKTQYNLEGSEYIVFSPNQIKSATGNNGDFDSSNPNITKSIEEDMREVFLFGKAIRFSKNPKLTQFNLFDNQLDVFDENRPLAGQTKQFGENDTRKFDANKHRWIDADQEAQKTEPTKPTKKLKTFQEFLEDVIQARQKASEENPKLKKKNDEIIAHYINPEQNENKHGYSFEQIKRNYDDYLVNNIETEEEYKDLIQTMENHSKRGQRKLEPGYKLTRQQYYEMRGHPFDTLPKNGENGKINNERYKIMHKLDTDHFHEIQMAIREGIKVSDEVINSLPVGLRKNLLTPKEEPKVLSIEERINRAGELGKKAFHAGKKAVPAQDSELMKLLEGLQVGQRGNEIMEAWSNAWHKENSNAPIEKQPYEMKKNDWVSRFTDKYYSCLMTDAEKVKAHSPEFHKANIEDFNEIHKKSVQQALSEGKAVPEEVLKDYPELKHQYKGISLPAVEGLTPGFTTGDKPIKKSEVEILREKELLRK